MRHKKIFIYEDSMIQYGWIPDYTEDDIPDAMYPATPREVERLKILDEMVDERQELLKKIYYRGLTN